MSKPDLSIIIPFAGEYPQVLFTIQAIATSLHNKISFEIIAVDNNCKELEDQHYHTLRTTANTLTAVYTNRDPKQLTAGDINDVADALSVMRSRNKSGEAIEASARGNSWLKYMKYDERLSHWECKRLACLEAKADTFLFIDAHCIPSAGIADMYSAYTSGYDSIGTFHMPLTYKILEWRRLVYKMVVENNFYGYSFTGFPGMADVTDVPVEVPCMSTCGMMISRKVYNRVGGWPADFRAYGGGENFMNYALAVTGHMKYIYPTVTLHHHGEKRDYHYTYDGTLWNRLVAHYLFGGKEVLSDLLAVSKGKQIVLDAMKHDILYSQQYAQQRHIIKKNQVVSLKDWTQEWKKEKE